MYYEEVFKALNKAKIDYLVAGGIAVVLHGYLLRFTPDLDLFVNLEEKNLLPFGKVMSRLGYRPKAPVEVKDFARKENRKKWIREKNLNFFSYCHNKDATKVVDILIKEPINYKNIEKKSKVIKIGKVNIPVIPIQKMSKNIKPNLSSEQLHHFSTWTAKQKLQWLEEAKRFVDSLPKKIRNLHEKFRKSEI